MIVFLFKLTQRNVRQIRFDFAMNVLRIYPSKPLTVFIQQIQGVIYLHAKEGGRAAISNLQFYRSKVFALVEVQCVERKYAQLDDPRTVFCPMIDISICYSRPRIWLGDATCLLYKPKNLISSIFFPIIGIFDRYCACVNVLVIYGVANYSVACSATTASQDWSTARDSLQLVYY